MPDFFAMRSLSSGSPSFLTVLIPILLSFLLSTMIAYLYEKTFHGLSYSRNFVQALILGSIVVSIVMQAIGDNIVRGLGMLGALAIIRFRTNLKDTRDMVFLFASMAVGISSGVHSYGIAVIGGISFCLAVLVLAKSPLGQKSFFDGLLRFSMVNSPENNRQCEEVLARYCRVFVLITIREISKNRFDTAYHVKFKNNNEQADFLSALNRIESMSGVQLLLQETTVDV